MLIFDKAWSEFKAIIDNNSLYFDYEQEGGDLVVLCQRNAMIGYRCYISIDTDQSGNPVGDYADFVNNYQHLAGEKKLYVRDYEFAVVNTQETFDFKLVKPDGVNVDCWLFSGELYASNAASGDSVVFSIVDVDNVLGYGPGFVIQELLRLKLISGSNKITIDPPSSDIVRTRKRIPAGVYCRLSYSTSAPNGQSCIVRLVYEY